MEKCALFTRGVMLDIARLSGVEVLPATYEITVADMEEAMRRQHVDFGAGDTVLVRTGWGRHYAVDNALYLGPSPGIGIAAAEWLAQRNVMMVGADNCCVEIRPNPDKDLALPVHGFMLVYTVSSWSRISSSKPCRATACSEFAFILQTLAERRHRFDRRADCRALAGALGVPNFLI